jgi:hypothetical protein
VVPQYREDIQGDIEIIGAITGGSATNIWFATLPSGYRPVSQQQFWVGTNGATASLYGQAGTDGSLKIDGSSYAGTYLFNGTVKLTA